MSADYPYVGPEKQNKYVSKEDDGDDLDGHGVVAPGHLAHSVPPLPQHKVLLQRRKFVDVQNLQKVS